MVVAGELDGDPIEGGSTGEANVGNLFRLDGLHYVFNLGTKDLSQGGYRILISLDDGSAPKSIDIGLK